VRTRLAPVLVCALLAAPAALQASDAPRPVRPAPARKADDGSRILDFARWLRERARTLGDPFTPAATPSLPAAPTPRPSRDQCPIGYQC